MSSIFKGITVFCKKISVTLIMNHEFPFMKKISLLLFLLTSTLSFSQNSVETCEILNKINALIQAEHYRPKPVDDSLSVFVFACNSLGAHLAISGRWHSVAHRHCLVFDKCMDVRGQCEAMANR